jgi:phospholipid-binding lipoprotein MlaA
MLFSEMINFYIIFNYLIKIYASIPQGIASPIARRTLALAEKTQSEPSTFRLFGYIISFSVKIFVMEFYMLTKLNRLSLIGLLFLGLNTITTIYAHAESEAQQDRFEAYNRRMFAFNQGADKVVFTPIATGYNVVVPGFARTGIHHVFSNIDSVPIIINDFLQLKGNQGARDLWRLFFNTTFGVLGIFDVASKMGLPAQDNDFGVTLAQWGYKDSHYFILPFLGPSTVRDGIGTTIDYNFLMVYPYINDRTTEYSLIGLDFVQRRADLLRYQNLINQASVDQYVFQRDAFMQKRAYTLKNLLGKDSNDASAASDADFLDQ